MAHNLLPFLYCRSALQISSEASQIKPGHLIPNTNSSTNSDLDQVFNGLGLGSYVSPPKSNLSLSDKQKMLKDSEVASKLASQPQLKPVTSSNNTRQNFQAKDLTATLMEANVNQMKNSQTFSNFNSFQPQPQPQPSFQPTWRPQQNVHQQPAFMVRLFFHVQA